MHSHSIVADIVVFVFNNRIINRKSDNFKMKLTKFTEVLYILFLLMAPVS